MFSLIFAWIKGWVNNRETGDLRRHRAHYGIDVMILQKLADTMGWLLWRAFLSVTILSMLDTLYEMSLCLLQNGIVNSL